MKFCNFGNSGESIPLQCSRELVCLAGGVSGSQSTTRKRKSSSSPTRKVKKARPTKEGSDHLRRRAALLRKETDAAEKEAAYKKKAEEKKADEKKVVEPVKNPRKSKRKPNRVTNF